MTWKSSRGSTYDLFEQQKSFSVRQAIVQDVVRGTTPIFGFDLLPSNPDLVDIDLRLTDFMGYSILHHHLEQISDEYDYIICDCPPNFNPVTKNALWTSDAYIVPTIPDFLSTYGIGLLGRAVQKWVALQNVSGTFTGPALGGIILTRVRNTNLHKHYMTQVHMDYPGSVFQQIISDSIAIANAPHDRIPISAIYPAKNHTFDLQQQFQNLAGEFIARLYQLRSNKLQAASLSE